MRRVVLLGIGVGIAGSLGAAALPAQAVPGKQIAVYYQASVAGEPVAEFPGNVRVFSACGGVTGAVCTAADALPPQEFGVFAGDTSVDVAVRGEDGEVP